MLCDDYAITKKTNGCGHHVTEKDCSCMYFSAMQIPCRHIFKFLITKELELFKSDLCAQRWTKSYYYKSHPAISGFQYVAPNQPIHLTKVRVPEEIEKFKRTAAVTKDINTLVSNMSNSQFEYFFEKIKDMRSEIRSEATILPQEELAELSRVNEMRRDNQNNRTQSSIPNESASNCLQQRNGLFLEDTVSSIGNRYTQNDGLELPAQAVEEVNNEFGRTNQDSMLQQTLHREVVQQEIVLSTNRSVSQPLPRGNDNSNLSVANIYQRITLPSKIVPVGRPKGSGNTTIGLKRKNKKTTDQNPTPTKKSKFSEKSFNEQGITVSRWLTNWNINRIGSKKITMNDIIQDSYTFNRLRNDHVNLSCIKKYFDKKTFVYIVDEVKRLQNRPYGCRKCRRSLNGLQVMCHGCLDWYHGKCIDVNAAAAKNIVYFCSDC